MALYNIYNKISEAEFTALKRELSTIDREIFDHILKNELKIYSTDTHNADDVLGLNFNVNLKPSEKGNISIFLNPEETGFDVTNIITKDVDNKRFFLKRIVINNANISEIKERITSIIDDSFKWITEQRFDPQNWTKIAQ